MIILRAGKASCIESTALSVDARKDYANLISRAVARRFGEWGKLPGQIVVFRGRTGHEVEPLVVDSAASPARSSRP